MTGAGGATLGRAATVVAGAGLWAPAAGAAGSVAVAADGVVVLGLVAGTDGELGVAPGSLGGLEVESPVAPLPDPGGSAGTDAGVEAATDTSATARGLIDSDRPITTSAQPATAMTAAVVVSTVRIRMITSVTDEAGVTGWILATPPVRSGSPAPAYADLPS